MIKYKNPVIKGFYPDPSVCSAYGKYYLAASSFQYFPGVPIFESEDLVNWRQIGYAITRSSQVKLEGVPSSGGIFAPTLRFYDGRFYMVTNNNSADENYYIYTDDINGEWSEPVVVEQDGIDPSLLFDEGHVYFISNGSDENGRGVIRQCEIDIETGRKLTETKAIWGGTGGRYLESPHMYHIGEWYYLMAAEGGTEYGHMVTYARSRSVWGPFESYPDNPVLTNRNKAPYILQGIGHGDLIERADGCWFIITLGFRQIGLWQPYHHLGREVFLTPVKFREDGWFEAGLDGTTDEEYEIEELGNVAAFGSGTEEESSAFKIGNRGNEDEANALKLGNRGNDEANHVSGMEVAEKSDYERACRTGNRITFENTDWNIDWCYMRIPKLENYVLDNDGAALFGSNVTLYETKSPTFIALRQRDFEFELSVRVKLQAEADGKALDEAGVCEKPLEVKENSAISMSGNESTVMPMSGNENAEMPISGNENAVMPMSGNENDVLSVDGNDNDQISKDYMAISCMPEGGITIYQTENEHYDLALTRTDEGYAVVLKLNLGGIRHVETLYPIDTDEVCFMIRADALGYRFSIKINGDEKELGYGKTQFLSSEVCGGFTGVMLGLYAVGECKACFSEFELEYSK